MRAGRQVRRVGAGRPSPGRAARAIVRDEEFDGSIRRTTVPPRVILPDALGRNAGGHHNRPVATGGPSSNDVRLTASLQFLHQEVGTLGHGFDRLPKGAAGMR